MLKGIPKILSPELLMVLAEMGHSDRLVIGDGNFPAESMGKDAIVIRMDGHGVPEILDAILQVFPLDTYVEHPVSLMEVMPGDPVETPIWDTYKESVLRGDKEVLCDHRDGRVGSVREYHAAEGCCNGLKNPLRVNRRINWRADRTSITE